MSIGQETVVYPKCDRCGKLVTNYIVYYNEKGDKFCSYRCLREVTSQCEKWVKTDHIKRS